MTTIAPLPSRRIFSRSTTSKPPACLFFKAIFLAALGHLLETSRLSPPLPRGTPALRVPVTSPPTNIPGPIRVQPNRSERRQEGQGASPVSPEAFSARRPRAPGTSRPAKPGGLHLFIWSPPGEEEAHRGQAPSGADSASCARSAQRPGATVHPAPAPIPPRGHTPPPAASPPAPLSFPAGPWICPPPNTSLLTFRNWKFMLPALQPSVS